MKIYNDVYSFDDFGKSEEGPAWFFERFFIVIFDLSPSQTNCHSLRPFIIIIKDQGLVEVLEHCYKRLVLAISRRFKIPTDRALWLKKARNSNNSDQVASFKLTEFGLKKEDFGIVWRDLNNLEQKIISQCVNTHQK